MSRGCTPAETQPLRTARSGRRAQVWGPPTPGEGANTATAPPATFEPRFTAGQPHWHPGPRCSSDTPRGLAVASTRLQGEGARAAQPAEHGARGKGRGARGSTCAGPEGRENSTPGAESRQPMCRKGPVCNSGCAQGAAGGGRERALSTWASKCPGRTVRLVTVLFLSLHHALQCAASNLRSESGPGTPGAGLLSYARDSGVHCRGHKAPQNSAAGTGVPGVHPLELGEGVGLAILQELRNSAVHQDRKADLVRESGPARNSSRLPTLPSRSRPSRTVPPRRPSRQVPQQNRDDGAWQSRPGTWPGVPRLGSGRRRLRVVADSAPATSAGNKGAENKGARRPRVRVPPRGPALWGGALPHPSPPSPRYHTPRATVANRGPCSLRRSVRIPVKSFADILRRTRYPPGLTVVLEFQQSVALPEMLVLGSNFSCTIMVAGVHGVVLSTTWSDRPALSLYSTSNVLMAGISIRYGISKQSKMCQYEYFTFGREAKSLTCPAVYVAQSYGIQITKASVFGRVDVFRSVFVRLDYLRVTAPAGAYNKAVKYQSWGTFGVIRMGEANAGSFFVSSNNVISNCEVFGHWELITIFRGAAGVTVRNNYLHDFLFAGIRCGAFAGFVMDCHHSYLANNLIYNPPAYVNATTAIDNAGIYLALHWFNPGNYITCNHVENQRQCIYLDEVSSGVTVDGGMCSAGYVGVKVNNGKFNTVRSLVVVKNWLYLTYVSCEYVKKARFPQDLYPRNWEGLRRAVYNTPEINRAYPYMQAICNPVPSMVRRSSCNAPGGLTAKQTGKCSGLGYSNDVEVFAYVPSEHKQAYLGCKKVPAMPKVNRQAWVDVTRPDFSAGFLNPAQMNFGLKRTSPLYRIRPRFKSCPRQLAGRKLVPLSTYIADYNIARPWFFDAVLTFPDDHMINPNLEAKS